MHVEWRFVTDNPQLTRRLIKFGKLCCASNTSQKLALRTSVTAVTLLVYRSTHKTLCFVGLLQILLRQKPI